MPTTAAVPELDGQVLLTDSGVETDLIFTKGVDLPLFASFVLADDPPRTRPARGVAPRACDAALDAGPRGQPGCRHLARVQ